MIVISSWQDVSVMKIFSADRQPEFTQVDMELSFVDVDDVIDVNERLSGTSFQGDHWCGCAAANPENDMAGSNGSFWFR